MSRILTRSPFSPPLKRRWRSAGLVAPGGNSAPPTANQIPFPDGATTFDQQVQSRAVECFNQSLRLAPHLLPAYQALAEAQIHWNQSDNAADTYRRLLSQFPENLDALRYLSKHYRQLDQPFEQLEYALRAQRLKPLDKEIAALVWSSHASAARHLALKRQWDQAREELAVAEKLGGDPRQILLVGSRKAALEFKAGNFAQGWQFADQAKTLAKDAAEALFAIVIEAQALSVGGRLYRDLGKTMARFPEGKKTFHCGRRNGGTAPRVLG